MSVAMTLTCPGLYCGRRIINDTIDEECGFQRSASAHHSHGGVHCVGRGHLLVTEPVGYLSIRSCRVQMLSDWYTMLYNPSPTIYTIVLIYYAFCLVMMMLLRPLLVKKIACGLGKSDRFRSIYAALYFFPILTVLQAVGGGLLYYAFPYIILVLSLVTLAVYMSASEIQSFKSLGAKKKRLVVLFSHWLLHAYGIISISRLDKLEQDLPLLVLVPGPALFYIATAKFTEPSRILSEGGNGH
ncbi:hypothetical protein WMY93_016619 [Mugilogobius chulae]|uniref:JNK1/MAPK8-associated membrane protein n=1 Tax=Mugilogobius chulae TaxID=88201 RepID=A0AAW0NQS9_9GOBI